MIKRRIIVRVLSAALAVLLAAGCSRENAAELPEDNPANHGYTPIMETEKGYYSNYRNAFNSSIYLRFYERGTENQVFVCARPECQHNGGQMCTATRSGLDFLNTILYNGWIYILAIEEEDETVSYNLYKAALDGTSLTKVGSAFSVNNSSGQEYRAFGMQFIIHKGYAYVPYHLSFGDSSFGFAGSGLVKMDISDGSTETLLSGDNYFSDYPYDLQGSGDHIYYNMGGVYRYNITSGESEKLPDINWYETVGQSKYYTQANYGKDGVLVYEITAYDKETGEKNIIHSSIGEIGNAQLLPYKDMLFAGIDGDLYVYRESGELLAEFDDFYEYIYTWGDTQLMISEDKLYAEVPIETEDGVSLYDDVYDCEVYSYPIDELLKGNIEKTLEYKVKNFWTIEKEFGRDVFE